MNKLIVENVIMALECCITKHHENCCQLGTWSEEWNCMTGLMKNALALLREKDAEIDRLKKHLDYKCIYGYDGDVMEYCVQGPCPNYKTESQIRADAINEFADRLKYALCVNNEENTDFFDYSFTLETIDQIKKELREVM